MRDQQLLKEEEHSLDILAALEDDERGVDSFGREIDG